MYIQPLMDSAISVREFVNKLASSAMMFGPRVDPCHHAGSTPIYRSVSTPSSLVKPFLYDYILPSSSSFLAKSSGDIISGRLTEINLCKSNKTAQFSRKPRGKARKYLRVSSFLFLKYMWFSFVHFN